MKSYVNNWSKIAVYLGALAAMILAMGEWNSAQKFLLASLALIHLHFFEEMDFPGGFPYMGVWAELKVKERDARKWDLNKASAAFGNEWFAALVYLLPLIWPTQHWLLAAAGMFSFVELLMHLFFFPIKIKHLYNPGLLSAALGLVPLSIWFFSQHVVSFGWLDWVLGVVWIAFNYWFGFRSPVYKYFGNMKQYSFSPSEVAKADRFMKNV